MTCHVTACTYSRSLCALKALVRYRNIYGQYHASARPIKCKDKISTHSCRPVSSYWCSHLAVSSVESGTLSLWSILLWILWIIPPDICQGDLSHSHSHGCDIVCVNETHLSKDIMDAEIDIPGFTMFRKDRDFSITYDINSTSNGGGSIIYVRNHLNPTHIEWFIGLKLQTV